MPIYKLDTFKRENGRRKQGYKVVVCYTQNGQKKQKSKRVYGIDEAKEVERQLSKSVTDSVLPAKMTVQELYDEYIIAKKNEVRTSSLEKSKSVLNNHVLPYLKSKPLDKLTVAELQKWKNKIGDLPSKISTKNNTIKEFNTLLNYAVRLEYIPKNNLKAVGRFKDAYFETAEDRLHYYTAEEFHKYIVAAEKSIHNMTDRACYIFFNIAFYTGMRMGEINALKWSDIEDNTIHVRRSVSQKIKGKMEETPPKNKSSYRSLQMPSKLRKILDEHRAVQTLNYRQTADLRVCGGIKVIADSSIRLHNDKYAELAGLPHIRVHDFRHSHATLLCNANINIQEIARRLGHADVSMTWNTYSHLYPKQEELALEVLNSV